MRRIGRRSLPSVHVARLSLRTTYVIDTSSHLSVQLTLQQMATGSKQPTKAATSLASRSLESRCSESSQTPSFGFDRQTYDQPNSRPAKSGPTPASVCSNSLTALKCMLTWYSDRTSQMFSRKPFLRQRACQRARACPDSRQLSLSELVLILLCWGRTSRPKPASTKPSSRVLGGRRPNVSVLRLAPTKLTIRRRGRSGGIGDSTAVPICTFSDECIFLLMLQV